MNIKEPKESNKVKIPKVEGPQSAKGMRDIIGDDFYLYQGFFEKAAEVAVYYGFKPIETPILEKEELFARGVGSDTDIVEKEMYTLKTKGGDRLALRPEFTASIMRAYIENGMQSLPQPVMLYYYGPAFRHENPQRGRYRQFWQFGMEMLGTKKSIADATIIMLAYTILKESGFNDPLIKINSIGDTECRGNYRKELVNYYKRNARNICNDCRERLKTNPLRLLDCKNPACEAIKAGAPEAIGFLCSSCKAHFKEVLEYLDAFKIPYEIDNNLVRGLDYYSRTVFEIKVSASTEEGAEPLSIAGGGRYDYLSKFLGSKKDVPAIGMSFGVDRIVFSDNYAKLPSRIAKKPKVYFIQLSFDAKLHSFEIIEVLRKNKIPVVHSLSKDSLGSQLAMAEKMEVPYTLILGQKEALEGTVIVRNMDTRSQDTVKVEKLAEYLKKVK